MHTDRRGRRLLKSLIPVCICPLGRWAAMLLIGCHPPSTRLPDDSGAQLIRSVVASLFAKRYAARGREFCARCCSPGGPARGAPVTVSTSQGLSAGNSKEGTPAGFVSMRARAVTIRPTSRHCAWREGRENVSNRDAGRRRLLCGELADCGTGTRTWAVGGRRSASRPWRGTERQRRACWRWRWWQLGGEGQVGWRARQPGEHAGQRRGRRRKCRWCRSR